MTGRLARATAFLLMAGCAWYAPSRATAQLLPPLPGGSLVVTVTSPASGSTVSGTVTIRASVSVVGSLTVAGVQFFVDGSAVGPRDTSSPYSVSWNTNGAANGPHTIKAVARDMLGLEFTSNTVSVTVDNGPPPDTTPPTVSITSPADGATVSGTLTVTASASDDVGVASVQFLLDGVPAAEDSTAPYAVSWNTAAIANGSHTLTAVARDAAGNSTTSAGVTVSVANGSVTVTRFEEDNAAISAGPAGAWVLRGSEVAAFSDGAAGSSDVSGATATLTFTGTAVSWIGLKCSVCGVATVSIDGGPAATVDTAGPAAPGSAGLASEAVFTVSGLSAGSHTLTITITGDTSSGGAHVIVDAFDVSGTAPPAMRIEDTDPAVTYTGDGWLFLPDPRGTNGTAAESATAGARATVSFNGTGIRWVSFGNNNNGIARVFLDGALVGEVDTYSPTERQQFVVFSAAGLPAGAHTLAIEVTGTHNPVSTFTWVIIDAFDVTP